MKNHEFRVRDTLIILFNLKQTKKTGNGRGREKLNSAKVINKNFEELVFREKEEKHSNWSRAMSGVSNMT